MSISFKEIFEFEVGDIIYECYSGTNVEVRIETKPIEVVGYEGRRTLKWTATDTETGAIIEYLMTEGLEYLAAKLYRQPMYVNKRLRGHEILEKYIKYI